MTSRRPPKELRETKQGVAGYRARWTEAGDTLVEVLLALVVLGLTSVALLIAFGTSISASSEHRTLTNVNTMLTSISQQVISKMQSSTYISLLTSCNTPANYISELQVATLVPFPYTANYSAALATANPSAGLYPEQWWNGSNAFVSSCGGLPSDQPQLITIAVTSNATGVTYYNSFVVTLPQANSTAVTSGTAGVPAQLVYISQPCPLVSGSCSVPAGTPMNNFTMEVQSSGGAPVVNDYSSLTYSLIGGTSGAQISGCSGAEVNGYIYVSGCTISAAGIGYQIVATDSSDGLTGVKGATSTAFTVSAAGLYLKFTTQPNVGISGASFGTSPAVVPVIKVYNSSGPVVWSGTITLTTSAGTALNPTLNCSGTLNSISLSTVNGTVTLPSSCLFYGGYRYNAGSAQSEPTSYTFKATASPNSGSAAAQPAISQPFSVSGTGPAYQLSFSTQPTGAAGSTGATFAVQPVVSVEDKFGNLVSTANSTPVKLVPSAGSTLTCAGVLNPTITSNTGLATFASCQGSAYVNGLTLTATSAGLQPATSNPFNLTPAANLVVFTQQPQAGASGSTLLQQPIVTLYYQQGVNLSVVTAASGQIILTPSGGILSTCSGLTPNAGIVDVASCNFAGLDQTNNPAGYTMTATLPASSGQPLVVSAPSSAFYPTVPGVATQLVFTTPPTAAASASDFTAGLVKVEDSGGNIVTSSTAPVTLTTSGGIFAAGCATMNAVSGVVNLTTCSFAGLDHANNPSGYTMTAASAGLTSATSPAFSPTGPGPVTQYIVAAPSTSIAGVPISVTVSAEDSGGNVNPTYLGTADLSTTDLNVAAVVPADYTFVAGDNGVHNFTNAFTLVTAGTQTVGATDTVTSSITGTSANVTVSAGPPATASFTTEPSNVVAGLPASVAVTVHDAYGNLVPSSTVTVSKYAAGSSGAGSLTGTTTATTNASGVATFSNLVFTVAGNYELTATDGAATTNSTSYTVSAAVATHYVVAAPPTTIAGTAIAVTVTAEDQYNNVGTGYLGTAHFTSSDLNASAVLPADYTFVAGDNGAHTFASVKLVTAGIQTVTATDTVTGSITGTSAGTTVSPAAATHFVVSGPPTATAGTAFSVTVTAEDQYNNVATGYLGTAHFTSTDLNGSVVLPANYTFVAGDAGVHIFVTGVKLITAGTQTVTATDTVTSSITGTSANITVNPGVATHFVVAAPGVATAGTAFAVTVTAEDQYNNVATGYRATAHFTTTDAGSVTLPANYTFVAGDNGVHTFAGVKLVTAGTRTVTATDTVTPSITGTSANITVSAAAATHFVVAAPGSTNAGSAFSVTVTAEDQYNNVATGYVGTAHFTKTDAGAGSAVPANYTFVAGDAGVHTFTNAFTLVTAATQTVTATDTVTGSITGTSGNITVNPLAATHFVVAAPGVATAGTAFSVTVTAEDQYNNVATAYPGTAHFTSSDPSVSVVLPANYTFVAGDAGVHVFSNASTLVTPGAQTVTATDTVTVSITGTSANITVNPGAATHFVVAAPGSTNAGAAFAVTVTAEDQYNNVATGYRGTAHFTTTDLGAVTLPANYTFVAGDNGVHTFAGVKLVTAGIRTVTATDTVTGTITGTSANITVIPGAATHLVVAAPPTATAGTAFSVTVTAEDQYNNVATSYVGTAHFTTTDLGAVTLPANYTFVAGDNGVHVFSNAFTLVTSGNRTITATDTVTGSITGTSAIIAVSAGVATHFVVAAPGVANAGTAFSVTVTAKDQYNNVATGYLGTAHFTTTDAGAVTLPADYAFVAGDAGVHVFNNAFKLATPGTQTVTATDTVTPAITGTSANITVSPGAATHFVVAAPPTAAAGTAFSVTVTAEDQYNNIATSYVGTAHFTKTDAGAGSAVPANYTFVAGDNGVHTFAAGVKFVTAGVQTVTATDTVTGTITGTSAGTTVSPLAATHFVVAAPPTATAGTAFSVTVTAEDLYNNVATSYLGTAHFTKTDAGAGSAVPANYTFVAGDAGVHTFANASTLVTPGTQTVTATDTVTGTITGTSANIAVSAGAATHFVVAAPPTANAGAAFSVTLTAEDQYNNVATGYRGTAHFTTTDPGAVTLPANYAFGAGDNGVHVFSNAFKLVTTGIQTITATDTLTPSITGTSAGTTVSPGVATHFVVSGPPTATAGTAFSVTVTAEDQFNNVAPGYLGTAHFTSTDLNGSVVLPANYTFVAGDAGVHIFVTGVKLVTAGIRTVTATDTVTGTITGTSANITVIPGAATHLVVAAPPTATAGTAFSVTVTAEDQYNNVATSYVGTAHFTTTDLGAVTLPANYTFVAGDNGVHVFSNAFTLVTSGNRTITATDTVTGSITGTSVTIVVSAGVATHFVVAAPATVVHSTSFSVTVTAYDQYNNVAMGYRGTVGYTSTDGTFTKPANHTFSAGDAGVHLFSNVFKLGNAGSWTITVTDTVTVSITGTSATIVAS